MSAKITDEMKIFWEAFIGENPRLNYLSGHKINAWSFGNTPEIADDLIELVLEGKKIATCSLLRAYQGSEDEIPRAGTYQLLCDGSNRPRCVIFCTDTFICRFDEISEKHAYEEGEGDQTLGYWREVHRKFFSGYENFKEDEDLLCERFKVVYK